MAYYQVLNTDQGNKYDPGFMQNVNAVTSVLGKQLNKNVFQDAAQQNGLVPEYQIDSNGNTQINYKSPALVNRGYYTAGAPGNVDGKPAAPESLSKSIQDMLAGEAVANATKEAQSAGPGLADNLTLSADPSAAPSDTAPQGKTFAQAQSMDPTSVFQSALMQQASSNPLIAKSLGGAAIPKTPGSKKETVDEAITDASAGNRTFADVYRQFPTKIKQIQAARAAMANLNLSADPKAAAAAAINPDPTAPPASTAPSSAPAPAATPAQPAADGSITNGPNGAKYYSPSTKKYYDAQGNQL